MAIVQINLKRFLDQHVKPVAASVVTPQLGPIPEVPVGENAYNAFMAVIGGALDRNFSIDVPVPAGPGGAPALPVVTPIDPARVLNDIAKAIKQAETTLLDENLSIRNASVDVELTVAVAGAAGATAKFNLEIGPAPSD